MILVAAFGAIVAAAGVAVIRWAWEATRPEPAPAAKVIAMGLYEHRRPKYGPPPAA